MAKYVTLDMLGEGGMGVVYRARQEPLGREVAIKFLTGGHDHEFKKRFQREIQVSLKLEHPNIVKLLDAGEMDGKLFYVMEYLAEAEPLDLMVKKEGALAPARALDLAVQLADALQHCHAHGMVHRDVKPANIMVTSSGRAILMDFGLVADPGATLLTQPGNVVGTPRFLAPELIRGQPSTAASDLWALGVTVYELLTGRQPFGGESVGEIARAIVRDEAPAPSLLRGDLPPLVDAVMAEMLCKEPAGRIPDAATVRARFEEALAATGAALPARPRRRTQSAIPRITSRASTVPPAPAPRRLPIAAMVAAAALGLALLVVRARHAVAPVASPSAIAIASSPTSSASPDEPSVSPAEAADRLARALDTVAPLALLDEGVRKLVNDRHLHPTLEQQQARRQLLTRWQGRVAVAFAQARLKEVLRAFSPVRDRVFGAGGVPPEAQRALLEHIHELIELTDDLAAFGVPLEPLPPLISPRYGQIESPAVTGGGGVAVIMEDDRAAFPREAAAGPGVVPMHFEEEGDHRRMRASTDVRLPGADSELGTPDRRIDQVFAPHGLPGVVEVHALLSDTEPELGLRVAVARTPPATNTPWKRIAWLRPAGRGRHVAYHTLPPDLLAGAPVWVKLEAIYSWPRAILKEPNQDVGVPWLYLATPR